MVTRRLRYQSDKDKLMSAQNEEEVIQCLLKIIKAYPIFFYRDFVHSNPYFKSFLPELKSQVISELFEFKKTLSKEISTIDSDIESIKDIDDKEKVERLIQLRKECVLLIDEVNEKTNELKNLL